MRQTIGICMLTFPCCLLAIECIQKWGLKGIESIAVYIMLLLVIAIWCMFATALIVKGDK